MFQTVRHPVLPLFLFGFLLVLVDATGTIALKTVDLEPRIKVDSFKLFELLKSKHTGVDYIEPLHWDQLIREFSDTVGMTGKASITGICSGDFDGDSRPDLFLGYPFGGHRLYRNNGGLNFEDVTEKAGLSNLVKEHWAVGCCFIDYDGDSDLDIFVAGTGDVNLLLENLGNGTFRDRAAVMGVAHKGANIQMAFADYDLDGDLDGYLVTNRNTNTPLPPDGIQVQVSISRGVPLIEERFREKYDVVRHPEEGFRVVRGGEYDHLFRNDGNVFTDVSSEVGISGTDQGLAASWFDYDDDGDPDLYVANDFFGPDHFYRNDRGQFIEVTRKILPHVPWFSMGTDVADINNDGLLDLMGTDMAGSSHFKSKLGMGDMDKSTWFLKTANPPQYMRNTLFVNAGGGRFLEAAQMAGVANTDWTWSVKLADLDCDGWVDIYGTNGMTHDSNNPDLAAKADSLSGKLERAEFWRRSGLKKDNNFAFRNMGGLQFSPIAKQWGLDFLGVSYGATFADFDGDGDLDIAVASQEDPIRIYRNNSTNGHVARIRLRGGKRNSHGIGAKVTLQTELGIHVRYLNACQGYASANEPVVHFGLGEATRIRKLSIRWPLGTVQEFEDLSVDKLFIITEPEGVQGPSKPRSNPSTLFASSDGGSLPFIHKENEFDDYAGQPLLPHRLSRLGPGMAWGDVDGDGDKDVFVGGASGQPGAVYLGDGMGGFTPTKQKYLNAFRRGEDMGAVFFDAEGDGDLDLFVTSGGFDPSLLGVFFRDRLHLNDGKGNFTLDHGATENFRDSSGPVVVADYDRDGDLDLFIGGRVVPGRYPQYPVTRLLENDGGKFIDVSDSIASGLSSTGMITGALWSDMDGDGWVDLLITQEWGAIQIWKNEKGRFINWSRQAGTDKLLGWWTGITGSDIDRDGDIDYIIGNLGLNTKYHASSSRPWVAYAGDVDGSGAFRFVEACYEGDILFPVRGKSCSTHALPSLAKKFTTFQSFAKATLPQVYDPVHLKNTRRLEINELASGLLMNNGQGRMQFQPLPRLAQISAVFGMAFADVDADGYNDLCLAQNFFSPQPETGNVDGGLGLVLRGHGNGDFTPLRVDESGVAIPGDAKALAFVDLNSDSRPDIVATVNNGPVQVFTNRSSGGTPFVVRVMGVRSVGARVTVQFIKSKPYTAEVYAGSGYLTGNPTDLFLGIPDGDSIKEVQIRLADGTIKTFPPPNGSILELKL